MAKYRGDTTRLDNQTNRIYSQVISYYTRKKQEFLLKVINKEEEQIDLQMLENEFETQIFNFLSKAWNEMDNYIMELVNEDATVKAARTSGGKFTRALDIIADNPEQLRNGKIEASSAELLIKVFQNPEAVKAFKKLNRTNEGKLMKSTIYTLSGYLYESFIQYALKEVMAIRGAQKISNIVNNDLLSSFEQTGSRIIKEGTATKSAGASISPDVAMGLNKNNQNLADLSYNQNIEIKRIFNRDKSGDTIGSSLYDYINSGREDMFGFSMKRWNMNSNNTYTHSSYLKNVFNKQIFKESEGKTWNYKYANAMMQLEMAKNAIALMGPINIGIFSGSHFYWMDEIMRTRMLIMHLYTDHVDEEDQEEVIPYIYSTNVYLLEKAKVIGLKLIKLRKNDNYYYIRYEGDFN